MLLQPCYCIPEGPPIFKFPNCQKSNLCWYCTCGCSRRLFGTCNLI